MNPTIKWKLVFAVEWHSTANIDRVEEARLQGSAVKMLVPNNQMEVCVCCQIDMGEEAS